MELDEIRGHIDRIDDELLTLFRERMDLASAVAEYKEKNGLPILNRERERAVLARVTEGTGDDALYIHRFFSTLFELSRARQARLLSRPSRVRETVERGLGAGEAVFPAAGTVACQGLEGANAQEACDKLLPRGNIVYVRTFAAVFDAVDSGLCEFGVLPIENSSNGSLRNVYELLQRRGFSIVRMTRLLIRHELLVKPGTRLSEIRTVCSHEQALGQCSRYLAALPGVRTAPCANTAAAARLVSESPDRSTAAIASHVCAELYGLEVAADNIQDSENNYTRFIMITKEPRIYDGANSISLAFSCPNKPGALYDILALPAALGINMSKLESCPVTGGNFEFVFFMELNASVRDGNVLAMLEEMERSCGSLLFLGCYSEV